MPRPQLLLIGLIAALALTSCGIGDDGTDPSSGASTPTVPQTSAPTGAPSPTTDSMTPSSLNEDQLLAVTAYLKVRENANTAQYNARSWKREMRAVTTSDGLADVIEAWGPAKGSSTQRIARKHGYVVRPMIASCSINPAFPSTDSRVAAQCELSDLVATKDGLPLPDEEVVPQWPYKGPQPTPLLILEKSGSEWLVDADHTGQAS